VADHTQLSRSQKVMTLAGSLLGMLLAALDQTIVSTAGPAIQQDLHIEPALYSWLTTSYLIASAVMTPVWGKLSDLFGRRRILVQGIVVFLVGSLACGLSQSTTQLIAARVVQGLGGAALFTTAFAVIADLFSPRERGRYTGLFGAVFGLSSVVGPLVGGLVTDTVGWHWCFFLNLPVGAVALAVILTRMPPLEHEVTDRSLDVAGAFVFALAVVPLLVALSLGKVELREGDVGSLWNSPLIVGLLIAAVVFGVAFLLVERRARVPLIDLRLFENRAFALGNLASFFTGMAFLGAIVFLPLFMVVVTGASATDAGLTTTPLTFGIVIGNIVSGQISSRVGRYKFMILGALVLQMVGFGVMAWSLSPDVTAAGMAARMVLIGLGLGPTIPLFNLHISSAVEPRQIGAATSTATLARSLGSTMGIALLGNLFGYTLVHGIEERMATATAGLPPALVAAWRPPAPSTATGDAEGATAPAAAFDRNAARARVQALFAQQRDVARAALERDDPAALAILARAPHVDERLHAVIAAGGIARAVDAGFADARTKIADALSADGPGVGVLLADPALPALLKARIAAIPEGATRTAAGRDSTRESLFAGLELARNDAVVIARAESMAATLAALASSEQQALDGVAAVDRALKQAFTVAIARVYLVGIVFALLGLIVALFLPELPLRGPSPTAGPTPPAAD
jgi:EmrB/QacA subfamily drug resistance transporter